MEGAPFLLPSDLFKLLPQILTILKEGGREGGREGVVIGKEGGGGGGKDEGKEGVVVGKEGGREEEVEDVMVTLGAVLSFALSAGKAMRNGGRKGGKEGEDGKEDETNHHHQQQQQQLREMDLLLQQCLLALPSFLYHLTQRSKKAQRIVQRGIVKFFTLFEDEEEEEEEEGREEREGWSMVRLTAEVMMVVRQEELADEKGEAESETWKENPPSSSSLPSSCVQVSAWWAALLAAGAVSPMVAEEAWLEILRLPSLPSSLPPLPPPFDQKKKQEGGEEDEEKQQQEWRAAAKGLVENYDQSATKSHLLYFARLQAAASL